MFLHRLLSCLLSKVGSKDYLKLAGNKACTAKHSLHLLHHHRHHQVNLQAGSHCTMLTTECKVTGEVTTIKVLTTKGTIDVHNIQEGVEAQ